MPVLRQQARAGHFERHDCAGPGDHGCEYLAGSLIAVPGFSFVASPSAIVLAGCKPFIVEVDENLNLDLADLRHRWTPDIKAIMVVHMRGFAGDMGQLPSLPRKWAYPSSRTPFRRLEPSYTVAS